MRKGYLIRFIDIGLIILFGFLMISDLKVISQIALPGSEAQEETPPPPDDPPYLLGVVIEDGGQYTVIDLVTREPLYADVTTIDQLREAFRRQHTVQDGNMRIVIEPKPLSAMQQLVDVLDLCEAMAIPRDLNTEAALARIRS